MKKHSNEKPETKETCAVFSKKLVSNEPVVNLFLDAGGGQTWIREDIIIYESIFNEDRIMRLENFYEYLYEILSGREIRLLEKVYKAGGRSDDMHIMNILARLDIDKLNIILFQREDLAEKGIRDDLEYCSRILCNNAEIANDDINIAKYYLNADAELNRLVGRIGILCRSLQAEVRRTLCYLESKKESENNASIDSY
ncbi:hypothetical protein IKF81_03920 [Candidatus Saccharibacteria bacterium]|nr:hypothetical protein [Candidatus Saccharibacteria bacterium]